MKKVFYIIRERAVEIAATHNMVEKSVAEKYTDSELQEVLSNLSTKYMSFRLKSEQK